MTEDELINHYENAEAEEVISDSNLALAKLTLKKKTGLKKVK